jgi:hypothetical protein
MVGDPLDDARHQLPLGGGIHGALIFASRRRIAASSRPRALSMDQERAHGSAHLAHRMTNLPSEDRILATALAAVHRRTDQLFFSLLLAEWAAAIALAMATPAGAGGSAAALAGAVLAGAALTVPPLLLIWFRPGWWPTRHAVAASQMLWGGLFIQLTGGRLETHFHVFGSLAVLAFYRDWRALLTAGAAVLVDRLVRGGLWPASVYGVADPGWWRLAEHRSAPSATCASSPGARRRSPDPPRTSSTRCSTAPPSSPPPTPRSKPR